MHRLVFFAMSTMICAFAAVNIVGAATPPDYGKHVRLIKALPNGDEIHLYERTLVEFHGPGKGYDRKAAANWVCHYCYLVSEHNGISRLVTQTCIRYKESCKGCAAAYRTPDILDIKVDGCEGILLIKTDEAYIDALVFRETGDASTSYRKNITVRRLFEEPSDRVVAASILDDNRLRMEFADGHIEKWIVVDSTDKDNQFGKKPKLLWRGSKDAEKTASTVGSNK